MLFILLNCDAYFGCFTENMVNQANKNYNSSFLIYKRVITMSKIRD